MTSSNQCFVQASISKAVNLESLARWADEEGFKLTSTRFGFICIEPKGIPRRERDKINPTRGQDGQL